jgi:two-component system, OmpR family, sensor kinase
MPIRFRIALSTAALMIASLLVLFSGIYIATSRTLHADLDTRLRNVYDNYRRNPGLWYVSPGQIQLRPNPEPFASSGVYLQILNAQGEVAARSENLGREMLPVDREILRRNADFEPVYVTTEFTGKEIRIFSGRISNPIASSEVMAYVQVAEPLGPLNETLGELRRNLIIGGLIATLILTLGAWLVGDAAMRPLARMSATARAVGRTGDLSRRLDPPQTRDEAQLLAETFNDMLARLEETFNAQRRFVADASHELRTPLTALRANSDIMLRLVEAGMVDRDDLIEGLTDVQTEVDRMTRLVQNLLTLARADVGWRPELDEINLVDLIHDAARIASPLTRGQRFELDAPLPGGTESAIYVRGSADQIKQLVLILLDNAFAYSPAHAEVTLGVSHNDEDAVITVSDTGPGIPPEHLSRIFERFYRADDARVRAAGGAGLGLSIARWIVSVHRGVIDAQSEVGVGTTFTVTIPLVGHSESLTPADSSTQVLVSG